jgi:diguanylate cyclase (GGDEF)-like protein
MACRIGGEEFGIILRGDDANQSVEFAENLRKSISDLVIDEVEKASITASFGIATCIPGEPTGEWRERADKALYRSKNEGRDRVTTAD